MQAIMETIFEILYLSFAITAGLAMFRQAKRDHRSAIRLGKRLRRTEKAVEQSVADAALSAAKTDAGPQRPLPRQRSPRYQRTRESSKRA